MNEECKRLIETVKQYIDDHTREDFTIEQLAETFPFPIKIQAHVFVCAIRPSRELYAQEE